MNHRTILVPLATTAIAALMVSPAASNDDTSTQATPRSAQLRADVVLADSKFRPTSDGFGFANYSRKSFPDMALLTPNIMKNLFGRAQVCPTTPTGPCELTPVAREFMDDKNQGFLGGLCYGFAQTASATYQGLHPFDWLYEGSAYTTVNQLPRSERYVQKEIVANFAAQWLKETKASIYGDKYSPRGVKKPSQVVDYLVQKLKAGEQQVIVIGKADQTARHAITPIRVLDKGDDFVEIEVYDNNYPNRIRAIDVDVRDERWRYEASINPQSASSMYTGTATSGNLGVYSVRAGSLTVDHTCWFCGTESDQHKAAAEAAAVNGTLTWNGDSSTRGQHADLIITDESGDIAGAISKGSRTRQRNDIVDAEPFAPVAGTVKPWTQNPPNEWQLRADQSYRIALNGKPIRTRAKSEGITWISDGRYLSVDGVGLSTGEKDWARISPVRNSVTFYPTGEAEKKMQLALGNPSMGLTLKLSGVAGDSAVSARLGRDNLVVSASRDDVKVKVIARGPQTAGRKRLQAMTLPAGATVRVPYTNLRQDSDRITVQIGEDSKSLRVR